MPKRSQPLTEAVCRNAKPKPDGKPAVLLDGRHGLRLVVSNLKSGHGVTKQWRQQVVVNGKHTSVGHGTYPVVGLADARDAAINTLRKARQGEPVRTRKVGSKAQPSLTFAKAWQRSFDKLQPTWRNAKTGKQWRGRYSGYMASTLADKPIADITLDDILEVMEPIWHAKPTVGRNVLREIFIVIEDCVGVEIEMLPATKDIVKRRLGKQAKKEIQHHRAVSVETVPDAVAAIAAADANPTHKAAFIWAILNAARRIEVRRAEWSEINVDTDIWAQSGHHMKGGRTHKWTLTAPALRLLETRPAERDGLVFAGITDKTKMIADGSFANISKACGLVDADGNTANPHGFRSSFTDWAAANGFEDEVAEKCMSHAPTNKTRAAYARDERLDDRRELMTAWANYCLSAIEDHEALWASLTVS